MDFFHVVKARQSMRAYCDQPIEPEKLHAILDAINRGPSAGDLQAYEVFAVTNRSCLLALVHAAGGQDFIAQAPMALVFCANPVRSGTTYRMTWARSASLRAEANCTR